jgi:hypothetical protein
MKIDGEKICNITNKIVNPVLQALSRGGREVNGRMPNDHRGN